MASPEKPERSNNTTQNWTTVTICCEEDKCETCEQDIDALPSFVNQFGHTHSTCLACGLDLDIRRAKTPSDSLISKKVLKEVCIKSIVPEVVIEDGSLDDSFPFCGECTIKVTKLTDLYRQLQVIQEEFDEVRCHVVQGVIKAFVDEQMDEDRCEIKLFDYWKRFAGYPIAEKLDEEFDFPDIKVENVRICDFPLPIPTSSSDDTSAAGSDGEHRIGFKIKVEPEDVAPDFPFDQNELMPVVHLENQENPTEPVTLETPIHSQIEDNANENSDSGCDQYRLNSDSNSIDVNYSNAVSSNSDSSAPDSADSDQDQEIATVKNGYKHRHKSQDAISSNSNDLNLQLPRTSSRRRKKTFKALNLELDSSLTINSNSKPQKPLNLMHHHNHTEQLPVIYTNSEEITVPIITRRRAMTRKLLLKRRSRVVQKLEISRSSKRSSSKRSKTSTRSGKSSSSSSSDSDATGTGERDKHGRFVAKKNNFNARKRKPLRNLVIDEQRRRISFSVRNRHNHNRGRRRGEPRNLVSPTNSSKAYKQKVSNAKANQRLSRLKERNKLNQLNEESNSKPESKPKRSNRLKTRGQSRKKPNNSRNSKRSRGRPRKPMDPESSSNTKQMELMEDNQNEMDTLDTVEVEETQFIASATPSSSSDEVCSNNNDPVSHSIGGSGGEGDTDSSESDHHQQPQPQTPSKARFSTRINIRNGKKSTKNQEQIELDLLKCTPSITEGSESVNIPNFDSRKRPRQSCRVTKSKSTLSPQEYLLDLQSDDDFGFGSDLEEENEIVQKIFKKPRVATEDNGEGRVRKGSRKRRRKLFPDAQDSSDDFTEAPKRSDPLRKRGRPRKESNSKDEDTSEKTPRRSRTPKAKSSKPEVPTNKRRARAPKKIKEENQNKPFNSLFGYLSSSSSSSIIADGEELDLSVSTNVHALSSLLTFTVRSLVVDVDGSPPPPVKSVPAEENSENPPEPKPSEQSASDPKSLGRKSRSRTRRSGPTPRKPPQPRMCSECGKILISAYNLKVHMRTHNNEKPYLCPHPGCEMRFYKPENLKTHSRTHSQERPYVCPICNCRFAYRAVLRSHKASKHNIFDCEAVFECAPCDKKFITEFHLNKHLNLKKCKGSGITGDFLSSNSNAKIFCTYCEISFDKGEDFKEHQQTEEHIKIKRKRVNEARQGSERSLETQEVECEQCEEKFVDNRLLQIHVRKVHPLFPAKTPFLCQTCNKEFSTLGNLKTHQILHSDDKPFVCSLCGQKFNSKLCLNNHEANKHGQLPFCCEYCRKGFNKERVYRRHLFTNHKEAEFIVKERTNVCRSCFHGFQTQEELNCHMESHKDVICEKCGKIFGYKHELQRHIRKDHNPEDEDEEEDDNDDSDEDEGNDDEMDNGNESQEPPPSSSHSNGPDNSDTLKWSSPTTATMTVQESNHLSILSMPILTSGHQSQNVTLPLALPTTTMTTSELNFSQQYTVMSQQVEFQDYPMLPFLY